MTGVRPLGYRSLSERRAGLGPVHVPAVCWPIELPGLGGRTEIVDDDGQLPVFETQALAAVCARLPPGSLSR